MRPYYEREGIRLYVGDCRDVATQMEPGSISAVCTDPPYGISFMSKGWDHSVPGVQFWKLIAATMKPGAHLAAFGGTRTFHRIAVAIEDAGFEVRDTLMWLFGSGMPKSHDVSKAIDKAAGAQGGYGGPKSAAHAGWIERGRMRADEGHEGYQRPWMQDTEAVDRNAREYLPATPEAEQWAGWGTALKPAYEPVILARKPLSGTVASTVLAHGTGALNIDASRVASTDGFEKAWDKPVSTNISAGTYVNPEKRHTVDLSAYKPSGRWPANVLLDEESAAELDRQSGTSKSTGGRTVKRSGGGNVGSGKASEKSWTNDDPGYGDTGGASRFFYVAKASRRERGMGLHSTRTVKYNVSGIGGAALCAETVRLLEKATSDIPTVSWHTGESGVSITGLCHQDSLSTTLTAIRQITASTTSPSLMLSPINESTQDANSETVSGGSPAGHVASSNGLMWISTDGETVSHPSARDVASAVLLRISESDEDWTPLTNIHSTVKPLALMRWLLTLVTPPGGTILDPFAGSGSTLVAAAQLGIRAVGIELSEEYAEIAARRIDHALDERAKRPAQSVLTLGDIA